MSNNVDKIYYDILTALKTIQLQVSGKPRIYIDNTLEMAKRALKLTEK